MLNHKLDTADSRQSVKLRVRDLRIGMFVCQLDRPWEESPFWFEGFELQTLADIEVVQQHCEFVYIDVSRSQTVQLTFDATPPRSFLNHEKLTTLDEEIDSAGTAHKQTSNLIKSFIDEVRFGISVDVQLAKGAVAECVASILRNPDAMMFLTQICNTGQTSAQHAFNVCIYSIILGFQSGLGPKQLEDLGTSALLHDIGKVSIPDEILNKPSKLTGEEFRVMKDHPRLGRDILMSGRVVSSGAVDVAYGHHENLDGTGYPRGLLSHQLNQNCRIVAVVDKYAAITSHRPHRPARDHLEAIAILNKLARAAQIDPKLTSLFVSSLGVFPPGSIVELSTGELAIVLESNPKQPLRPRILVVRDSVQQPVEDVVDMAQMPSIQGGRPYKVTRVHRPGDFGIDPAEHRDAILEAFR